MCQVCFPRTARYRWSELTLKWVQICSDGIRGVWSRHQLLRLSKSGCCVWSAPWPSTNCNSMKSKCAYWDGSVLNSVSGISRPVIRAIWWWRTPLSWARLKGVGRVYLQSVMDGFSRYAWGRLYTNKLPVRAVHVLNNDVLQTFEQHQARITTVRSDNGRAFAGNPVTIPTSCFCSSSRSRRTSKVFRPQSNGYVERLHRTLLDEHFRIQGGTPRGISRNHRCRLTSTPTCSTATPSARIRGVTRTGARPIRRLSMGYRNRVGQRRKQRVKPLNRLTRQGRVSGDNDHETDCYLRSRTCVTYLSGLYRGNILAIG